MAAVRLVAARQEVEASLAASMQVVAATLPAKATASTPARARHPAKEMDVVKVKAAPTPHTRAAVKKEAVAVKLLTCLFVEGDRMLNRLRQEVTAHSSCLRLSPYPLHPHPSLPPFTFTLTPSPSP